MEGGRRLPGASPGLDDIRGQASQQLEGLPAALRRIQAVEPYAVTLSPGLQSYTERVAREAPG